MLRPLVIGFCILQIVILIQCNGTDGNGIILSKKVPNTITSWVITGFSLNEDTGLALIDQATKLKVFKPFFISINLPYSVKRGEIISIPVVIFNYLEKNLDVNVTLHNTDREYDFIEATNEDTESANDDVKRSKTLSVPSNSRKSVSFIIRPNKVGPLSLKITAISPIADDALQQTLKVEPKGVTNYVHKAVLLNLVDKNEKEVKVDIDIPENAVEDSEYVELSVIGDLLAPSFENFDILISDYTPRGRAQGEKNVLNFLRNILALKYLKAIKRLTPAVEEKATKFLEFGYQQQLRYKHNDGSYSTPGKSDESGSTWLTAYVVKSFQLAIPYIDIDPKIIEAGLKFLADSQLPSGEFPKVGEVSELDHIGGSIAVGAFVLLVFLENVEAADKYKDVIEKGLSYLEKELPSSEDQYSLSITAHAFMLGKREESAKKALARLEGLTKNDGGRKWWSRTVIPLFYEPYSVDVEMTAYVVLALLQKGNAEDVLPSVRWLISQRKLYGAARQATFIVLEALTKFAEKSGSGTREMTIDFTAGKNDSGSIKVSPENSLVLQTHVLKKTTREIVINAKGSGSCFAQVLYRYNTADKDDSSRFTVMPVVKTTQKNKLVLEVCSEFLPLGDEKESKMAVMEVHLPSGYTVNLESFDKIKGVKGVKRVDSKNSKSVIDIYFEKVTTEKTCVSIGANKTHAVAKQKPAFVKIYDYYDNTKSSTEFYEVKSSLCDICQGDDCGAGCAKGISKVPNQNDKFFPVKK